MNPGTLIAGTMRNGDLIPTFIDEIDRLKEELSMNAKGRELEVTAQIAAIDDTLADVEQRMETDIQYFDSQDAADDLGDLFDILNDFADDGYYFSAHPGDGCDCDYGFWSVEED